MKTKPEEQKCENCKYWVEDPPLTNGSSTKTGLCRRFPPVPVVRLRDKFKEAGPSDFITQGWPETWRGAWCGEWKAKT